MTETSYGITTTTALDFKAAVDKITQALKAQGFGVLTTIDVKAKMKEKLGKDMDEYLILGACNPPLAHEALQAETEIGLMFPCNVIVYRKDGKTHVAALRPSAAMGMIRNPRLKCVADQAEPKLIAALEAL